MKKLILFYVISLIMQFSYFKLFMTDTNSYNPISIITAFIFVGYFVKQTYYLLKYKSTIIKSFTVGIFIFYALFTTLLVLSFGLNVITAVIYAFFYNTLEPAFPLYDDSFIVRIFENNLFFINLSLFVINIMVISKELSNYNRMDKSLHIVHRILAFCLYIFLISFLIFNLPAFYFYNFFLSIIIINWLCIPVLYFCLDLDSFYGLLIGWVCFLIFQWPLIHNFFFRLYGFTLG